MDDLRADERLLLSADQTSSDADQGRSDADQTLSDTDQAHADQDQRAADRDQAAADREHDACSSLSPAEEAAYQRARVNRQARSRARQVTRGMRLRAATERDASSEQRDRIAELRDGLAVTNQKRIAPPPTRPRSTSDTPPPHTN
jgi:hypothetical protein